MFLFIYSCMLVVLNAIAGNLIQLHTASNGSFIRKYTLSRICCLFGGKYIAHIHGANFLVFYKSSSARRKRQILHYLQYAAKIVVLSESWKKEIGNWKPLLSDNIVVIPNPCPETFVKSPNSNSGGVKLLFSGRIGFRKGVYDLVAAMQIVVRTNSNIYLELFGDGEVDKLQAVLVEKKLQEFIRIHSWVNHQEYLKLIPEYDVFVLPSHSESFGMSVVEAMIAGLPVITTPVGAIPEFVHHGQSGLLIPPGDINQLAEAILQLAVDPESIHLMGHKAKLSAEKYCSVEHVSRLLSECYLSIGES